MQYDLIIIRGASLLKGQMHNISWLSIYVVVCHDLVVFIYIRGRRGGLLQWSCRCILNMNAQ